MPYTLSEEVAHWAGRGFRVESRTETDAQLVKPKKFHVLLFLLGLLALGVPGLIYLGWYLAQRDKSVYLYVDEAGVVQRKGGGGRSMGQITADKMQGHA